MVPLLDEIIESRVRLINFLTENIYHYRYILEYLYNEGLRQGDIILTIAGVS